MDEITILTSKAEEIVAKMQDKIRKMIFIRI